MPNSASLQAVTDFPSIRNNRPHAISCERAINPSVILFSMLVTQKRPRGSHFPSFNRINRSVSGWAILIVPFSSQRATLFANETTAPPVERLANAVGRSCVSQVLVLPLVSHRLRMCLPVISTDQTVSV